MWKTVVRDVMSHPPIVIDPEATLKEAEVLMEEERIRRLPVVNAEGRLVGIVSRSDVREGLSISSAGNPYAPDAQEHWLTVADVMTTEVVTVTPETPLWQAAELMLKHKIGGLPVVEGGEVVGMITESDIFKLVVQQWQSEMKTAH
ncbi:MAG: CBS domain-containing protein [Anaerolineae bacterium]|nr:CBS domain-containing protein [Anaerolineae bacterium]MDW8098860.1 CBS domain-containing protein [Anaerolineae bacterium]